MAAWPSAAQDLLQTHRISADPANETVAAVVAKCDTRSYTEAGARAGLSKIKDQLKQ